MYRTGNLGRVEGGEGGEVTLTSLPLPQFLAIYYARVGLVRNPYRLLRGLVRLEEWAAGKRGGS